MATATLAPKGRHADRPPRQPTPFGKLIRQLRQQRELSQATLAQLCHISPGYVGLIETGDRGEAPSLDIVRRFAQALALDVETTEELMRSAGHLGEDESLVPRGRQSFASFVSSDPRLSRDQKDLLIRVYESWLGKSAAKKLPAA